MKSVHPCGSEAARSGTSGAAARGKAGTFFAIGPSSRTIRVSRTRAGRPVKTFVTNVCSGRAALTACRYRGETFASSQRRNAVPICTADAHNANAAATPLGSPMPPAAMTGTFTASTICGTRAIVPTCASTSWRRNVPRCPPASSP